MYKCVCVCVCVRERERERERERQTERERETERQRERDRETERQRERNPPVLRAHPPMRAEPCRWETCRSPPLTRGGAGPELGMRLGIMVSFEFF